MDRYKLRDLAFLLLIGLLMQCVDITSAEDCIENACQFQCADKSECLSPELVCNGQRDCRDGSDEGDETNCNTSCDSRKCSQMCLPTPFGPQCCCRNGYKLESENVCSDIDECQSTEILCDHFCKNTNGSFQCSCGEGYEIENDRKTCLNPTKAIIYYAADSIIKYFSTSDLEIKNFYEMEHEPILSITVDPIDKEIYFCTKKAIYKRSENTIVYNRIQPLLNKGFKEIYNIALDYIGRNLYIVDQGLGRIIACNVNNLFCTTVIKDRSMPRGIALDLKNRYLFFTDVFDYTILRSDMDGRNLRTIVNLTAKGNRKGLPNSIALDEPANKLYWVDSHTKEFEQSNLDGKERKKYALQKHGKDRAFPYSIVIWQDKMYWSDWQTKNIYYHSKRNGSNLHELRMHDNTVYSLNIFHADMHQESVYVGECSHITLLSKLDSIKCKCPDGMELRSDGITCEYVNYENDIIYENKQNVYQLKDYIHTWRSELNSHLSNVSKMKKLNSISSLLYNPIGNYYLYLYSNGVLIKRSPYSKMQNKLHRLNRYLEKNQIAYDWLRRNVYWIKSSGEIKVTNEDSAKKYIKLDLQNVFGIDNIVVDPSEAFLFIFHMHSTIRCNLIGKNCTPILGHVSTTTALVDTSSNPHRLYWFEKSYSRIESCDLNGKDKKIHANFDKFAAYVPSTLLVNAKYIYWTTVEGELFVQNKSTTVDEDDQSSYDEEIPLNIQLDKMYPINLAPSYISEHLLTQLDDSNPCNNSKCTGFCFSTIDEQICGCSDDSVLSKDQYSCLNERSCTHLEFSCNNGDCIHSIRRCDGHEDCDDSSDEEDCSCRYDQFICDDGQCIPSEEKCNNMHECNDKSDERDCPCYGFMCDNGICINGDHHCDGYPDCNDQSDERSCVCNDDQFTCSDGDCIVKHKVCDGKYNCKDKSDEKNCSCSNDTIDCGDGTCIHKDFICDRIVDCENGADESKAHCVATECDLGLIHCNVSIPTSKCIHHNQYCDGSKDCPNGEDELCEGYISKDQLKSLVCPDPSKSHIDDGCAKDCICAQKCEQVNDVPECYCVRGYTLKSDNRSCSPKVESGSIEVIGNEVLLTNNRLTVKKIHVSYGDIIGVIYYPTSSTQNVYIIDIEGNLVVSKEEKYEEYLPILQNSTNFSVYRGVIENLYFVKQYNVNNQTHNCIYFCNLISLDCSGLLCTKNRIQALVVESNSKSIFTCEYTSENATIYGYRLNGQKERSLMENTHCESMVVDPHKGKKGRIYWTNPKNGVIDSIDTDGENRRIISTKLVHSPFRLSLMDDGDLIYYSKYMKAVVRCPTSSNSFYAASRTNCYFYEKPNLDFIVGPDPLLINDNDNYHDPCLNHTCPHNCIPDKETPVCICKTGYFKNPEEECVLFELCSEECEALCSHKSFGEICKMCNASHPCLPKISEPLLAVAKPSSSSSDHTAVITIIVLLLLGLAVLVAAVLYKKKLWCFKSKPRLNFTNPNFAFTNDHHTGVVENPNAKSRTPKPSLGLNDSDAFRSTIESYDGVDLTSPDADDRAPVVEKDQKTKFNYSPFQG